MVHAGQLASASAYYGDFTGLGSGSPSSGGNSFAGYTPFFATTTAANPAVAQAIRNLNSNAPNNIASPQLHGNDGQANAFADLTAQGNTFGSAISLTAIERVIYHDLDNSAVGFVSYGTLNATPAHILGQIHYYAADPSEGTANDAALNQTATGQKSLIRHIQIVFDSFVFLDPSNADPTQRAVDLEKLNGPGANGQNGAVTLHLRLNPDGTTSPC